jgi:hypothetical protein
MRQWGLQRLLCLANLKKGYFLINSEQVDALAYSDMFVLNIKRYDDARRLACAVGLNANVATII